MIIGVDAGALAITDDRLKVGVWRVTHELLKKLGKSDKKNIYRLFSFRAIDPRVMREFGPRMKNVVVKPRIGWARIQLPLYLRFHPVDVFLGLSQFLPPGRHKGIGFIYDVNFLRNKSLHPESHTRLVKNTQTVIDRSENIVTISEASRREIIRQIPDRVGDDIKKKITIAYPGVDKVFRKTGKKYVGKYQYFLYVGSLKRGKNIPMIIRTFAEFQKKSKQTYELLIIGGDFWRDPEIDKVVQRTIGLWPKLKDAIHFLGYVPDRKLAEYYRGARALVVPSIWEGFCLPAAEALACGTPVIGSITGSMPEVVGKAGLLLDPTKEKTLVKAYTIMATNGKRYQEMKSLASGQAKKFTWKKFAKKVLELL